MWRPARTSRYRSWAREHRPGGSSHSERCPESSQAERVHVARIGIFRLRRVPNLEHSKRKKSAVAGVYGGLPEGNYAISISLHELSGNANLRVNRSRHRRIHMEPPSHFHNRTVSNQIDTPGSL